MKNNSNYGLLLGTEYNGSISIYPAATVNRALAYPEGSRELLKAIALRQPQYTNLTGVESDVGVIAHETGYRIGLNHGDVMKNREFDAVRRTRR
ncbi:hypothetical protein MO867_15120 [Microbulbifer sp. OS29]|uniref:Uncharacterized protein n=1 Tax=Microbulbifer okhotskensis TaxID=2926617 RepID=A0A9X2J5L4_9GAMM|nr:hypothetical protein [Microbulbifer okhotskensis]MCO1335667.1 hypothetical protein [Microbulbifer okhotskensis]